jgi:hypothetical protein
MLLLTALAISDHFLSGNITAECWQLYNGKQANINWHNGRLDWNLQVYIPVIWTTFTLINGQ